MYTDDNGIVRFESTDNIAPLQVGLNAALESVSEAVTELKHDVTHLDADNIVEGTLPIEHRPDGNPFAMAAGRLTMNGTGTRTFNLPSGRFTQPPVVTITGNSSVQSPTQDVRAYGETTTSFSVRYQRADDWSASHSGVREFNWIAVQMFEDSAEG